MMFPLALLLLQLGIALLHHHHQGSYYDNDDQFHHISAESSCPGKIIAQLNPQHLFPAVIPSKPFVKIIARYVSIQHMLTVPPLIHTCILQPSHDRAPPA